MTKPSKPGRPGGPASKPGASKPAVGKPGAETPAKGGTARSAAARSGKTVQSRKIVNKRQTPWGLISITAVIVILAVVVVGYAVNKGNKKSTYADPNKIPGITHMTFTSQVHQTGIIDYKQSPPFGGPHNPYWADCTGTVYPNAIANENAVHTLEHGSVWITYKPGLPAAQMDVLTKLVSGVNYMLMSPYPGLKTNVSLQAWGYQLFVDSATDPRVKRFISDLRESATNTPEPGGLCSNPEFKTNPSTPGHPWAPATS